MDNSLTQFVVKWEEMLETCKNMQKLTLRVSHTHVNFVKKYSGHIILSSPIQVDFIDNIFVSGLEMHVKYIVHEIIDNMYLQDYKCLEDAFKKKSQLKRSSFPYFSCPPDPV